MTRLRNSFRKTQSFPYLLLYFHHVKKLWYTINNYATGGGAYFISKSFAKGWSFSGRVDLFKITQRRPKWDILFSKPTILGRDGGGGGGGGRGLREGQSTEKMKFLSELIKL